VAGLGLDVFEFRKVDLFGKSEETSVINDRDFLLLSALPNVIITPHTAYNTDVAIYNMVRTSTENIWEFWETGSSKNKVL
jgi:D-lactate dehydrogenase